MSENHDYVPELPQALPKEKQLSPEAAQAKHLAGLTLIAEANATLRYDQDFDPVKGEIVEDSPEATRATLASIIAFQPRKVEGKTVGQPLNIFTKDPGSLPRFVYTQNIDGTVTIEPCVDQSPKLDPKTQVVVYGQHVFGRRGDRLAISLDTRDAKPSFPILPQYVSSVDMALAFQVGRSDLMKNAQNKAAIPFIEQTIKHLSDSKNKLPDAKARSEAITTLPIIRGFTPEAVSRQQKVASDAKEAVNAAEKITPIDNLVTAEAAKKSALEKAQNAYDAENDPTKKVQLLVVLENEKKAHAEAKNLLDARNALIETQKNAQKDADSLVATSKELNEDPPSVEALYRYFDGVRTVGTSQIKSRLSTEINELKSERLFLANSKTPGSDDRLKKVQRDIDEKEGELKKLEILEKHPELIRDFFRSVQNGEHSPESVQELMGALKSGNIVDLLSGPGLSEIQKKKLKEMEDQLKDIKNDEIKSFFEKYKAYILTGGALALVAFKIIEYALQKSEKA